MNYRTILFFFAALIVCSSTLTAQNTSDHDHHPREILFPDIPGYYTLSADLHIHTVFSDGLVWPNIRVREAERDHLDAIAITDHLEYQPFQDDIPHPDRNRPYEIARQAAENSDVIVINGAEVTRSMPPGHLNAVFLEDVNELLVDDVFEALRNAKAQDAFIFWNHPSWSRQASDGIARLDSMHLELIEEGLIQGIEVVNSSRFSEEAVEMALDHDLTMIGASDVHGLIDWDWVSTGRHRPATLIFSETRTREGLKEALMEGRTVVAKHDLLIGKEEFLVPLVQETLTITHTGYEGNSSVLNVRIYNNSIHEFILQNTGEYSFHRSSDIIRLPAHKTTGIAVNLPERMEHVEIPFTVLSGLIGPEHHPSILLQSTIQ